MIITGYIFTLFLRLALPVVVLLPQVAAGALWADDPMLLEHETSGWFAGGFQVAGGAQLHWDEDAMRYRPFQPPDDSTPSLRLGTPRQDFELGGQNDWQFGVDLDAIVSPSVVDTSHTYSGYQAERAPVLELEAFLLSGHGQGLNFHLGRHQAVSQGLLFAGGSQWGLSAGAQLEEINSRFSVFGVNRVAATKDPLAGFGVAGESDYVGGGTWQSSLSSPWSSAITLSAGYVTGRETSALYPGIGLPEASYGSHEGSSEGYSLGLDSRWFRNQVHLSVETAISRFDSDISDQNDSVSDRAYSASVSFKPELKLLPLNWEIGAQAQEVGHHFHSPGNQALARDRSMERYYMRFQPLPDWSMGYSYRREAPSREDAGDGLLGDELFARGSLRITDWVQLNPSGQLKRERCRDTDTTVYHSLLSLTANTWLIPEALSYRNTIKLNHTRRSDSSPLATEESHQYYSGELHWQAISPGRMRPGMDVNLSFRADRYHSDLPQTALQNDYRIMLSVDSRLPGS
ncbi:MAG: hypothetical protein EA349_13560 [Halomonadaceae bacterium]|nr:MAG: hypothetical protein EA349_13560 [Halomonadaceae bacterium]